MTITTLELAHLFVDSLKLEDVSPSEIDYSAPLFGSGLGLDSLDLLEISLVIQQHYGVKIYAEDPNIAKVFGSLQSLADYINFQHVVNE